MAVVSQLQVLALALLLMNASVLASTRDASAADGGGAPAQTPWADTLRRAREIAADGQAHPAPTTPDQANAQQQQPWQIVDSEDDNRLCLLVLPEPHQQEVRRGRGEVVHLTPHLIHRRLVRITRRIREQRSRCQAEWLCGSCASTNWHQTMRCRSCLRRAPPALPLVPGSALATQPLLLPGARGQNAKRYLQNTTMAGLIVVRGPIRPSRRSAVAAGGLACPLLRDHLHPGACDAQCLLQGRQG